MAHETLTTARTTAAAQMNAVGTTTETLETMVEVARSTVTGIDHVGVTFAHRDGRLETVAATGPLVVELDELQYALDEGPCVSALRDDLPITLVEHAGQEQRWPRYVPPAVQRGITAQLSVRLFVDDRTVGVLNLYATRSETVSEDTRRLAELFAAHAALACGHNRRLTDLRGAIAHREIIDQAIGIVMERYDLCSDRAFEYLVRVSSVSEVKLRDVALDLVERTNTANGRAAVSD